MRTRAGICGLLFLGAMAGSVLLLLPLAERLTTGIGSLTTQGNDPTTRLFETVMPYAAEATKTSLQATQQYIAGQVARDQAVLQAEATARTWWVFTPLCMAWAILMVLLYLFAKFYSTKINTQQYAGQITETRAGTVAWISGEPQILLPPVEQPRVILTNKGGQGVQNVSPMLTSSTQDIETDEDLQALAKQLMFASANATGDRKVMGWRQLGWSSGRWQRVVKALRDAGVELEGDPTGTRLVDKTAADVYYDLDLQKIVL